LITLADLGYGVMAQALVEAAAYVIGATNADPQNEATFVRLLKDTNRPRALTEAIAASRASTRDHRLFTVRLEDLDVLPGSPVAYWMGPSIRRLFTEYPSLEGNGADVRVGLQTGDDFRFVRSFWEVDPARIARTRDETFEHQPWTPFAKGGEY